jgi:two-component system NtrC family sensor kinase
MLEPGTHSQPWMSAFDVLKDPVLVHDSEYRILMANRALLQRLGSTASQVTQQSCEQVLPRGDASWSGCPYCARTSAAEAPDAVFGGYSRVSSSTYAADGAGAATIHIITDTSEQHEYLRRTQEQLLQSEKMSAMGQLISGVAHELNNPLTAILGYAQLLDGEPLGARARDFVRKLFKQAQRTHRVVHNLLSFARQYKPSRQPVDLGRVLEDTLLLRDYDLKLSNIELVRDLPAELPMVTADAHQFEQVFLNIINNAVDAILEGGRSGRLQVRMFAHGTQVRVEFHDSGPGIAEPTRIFDPFYTTKGVGKGTGLGLSICYGIVKEHGGEIEAFNHREGGAVLRITLPAASAETMQQRLSGQGAEGRLQGRILLVDDEEALLDFEREVLTTAGAEVETVNGAEAAMQRLAAQHYDALVVDGKMPGAVSGTDLYQWICACHPEMQARLMFTLSNVTDPETRAFLQATGVACLPKPFDVKDFLAAVATLLRPQKSMGAQAT